MDFSEPMAKADVGPDGSPASGQKEGARAQPGSYGWCSNTPVISESLSLISSEMSFLVSIAHLLEGQIQIFN